MILKIDFDKIKILNRRYFLSTVGAVGAFAALSKCTVVS